MLCYSYIYYPKAPLCNGSAGSRYPRWRCNGVIMNNSSGDKCCNGREITVRRDSFFNNKKISVRQVMAILLWLVIANEKVQNC
ncbi:hypothetical protein CU097_005795 [Rhizopus azygosporus]|uniref:Uncharacterized protein n=1 Tax=Rhizopus azygosporus TaxID=86630 RepID=A0A367JD41_RHIAZ|nr:hypothetical protein CU097_005795 [Rhizopus azygosporus]